jgi:hypothetical protein
MNPTASSDGFSDNHKNHILCVFRCISDLLDETESALIRTHESNPFERSSNDSTPAQREGVHAAARQMREAMLEILSRHEIPIPSPAFGGVWAAQGSLLLAKVQIDELSPDRMVGYGPLPGNAVDELGHIQAELLRHLETLNGQLIAASHDQSSGKARSTP